MKRFVLILLMIIHHCITYAYDVKIKGICYNLNKENKTACVTFEKEVYEDIRTDYQGKIDIDYFIEVDSVKYVVNTIGEYAFYKCKKLTNIVIPNTITTIENNAFEGCTKLNTIILPNSVTTIGAEAFCKCYSLNNLFVSNTVNFIDYDAFYECINLRNIYIASLESWCNINFVTLYSNPLHYAHQLLLKSKQINDLILPNSVTSIKPYTFAECYSLTLLQIPNTVTTIGEMAFWGCENMKIINIPASVERIENKAFKHCCKKGNLYLYNPDVQIEDEAFDLCSGTLHVQKGHVNAYQIYQQWEDFTIVDDIPPFCLPPMITYEDGQLRMTSDTPGATCHLIQNIQEINSGDIIKDIILSIYATAEGYQPSKVVNININDLFKN